MHQLLDSAVVSGETARFTNLSCVCGLMTGWLRRLLKVPGMERFTGAAVLARSPGYLPGELLSVKGVDPFTLACRAMRGTRGDEESRRDEALEWYCQLQCVCVLSIKGSRENGVADKMQGGDYDGDKCTVIWDERIAGHLSDEPAHNYSAPELDPLMNSVLSREDDANARLWECAEAMVRKREGLPAISALSVLHTNWSDRAAHDWSGDEGKKAKECGDLCHKAVDMYSAGYILSIPEHLLGCEAPRYCFQASGADPQVFVGGLPSRCTDRALQDAFEREWPSTRTAHVTKRQGSTTPYGFVTFRSQRECNASLKAGSITVLGEKATVQPDTTKRKKRLEADAARPASQSAVGKLWEVVYSWREKDLAGLDAPTEVPKDVALEDERLRNPALEQQALEDFRRARDEMRQSLQKGTVCDPAIKARLLHERNSRIGDERDKYASAMWLAQRKQLNSDLKTWLHTGARSRGEPRPEIRGWVEELYGCEWNRIKKLCMPPTRSAAGASRGGSKSGRGKKKRQWR
jgi:hypothetical protein